MTVVNPLGAWAGIVCAIGLIGCAPATAQRADPYTASGFADSADVHVRYVQLGAYDRDALLYDPAVPRSDIALIYSHPDGNNFGDPVGQELARRGHRILMVNLHDDHPSDDALASAISRGIAFLRGLAGVRRVVLIGHSGGGQAAAFYANVAANGPAACNGPEKVYPCDARLVANLAKPDGLILLDTTLGAFHEMSGIDPAFGAGRRIAGLDMFAAENGFDAGTRSAHYSNAFVKIFLAAQAARNASIMADARARLDAIGAGKGAWTDDEPFVVRGMGVASAGARLYQPDTALLGHTHRPRLLLAADGSDRVEVIHSVRPAQAQGAGTDRTLSQMTVNTTVRHFLASGAIRTRPDFAIGEDTISGVDWASAMSSAPANAAGIRIPTLVLAMTCHYLLVPGELTFDAIAAADKTFAAVEGATHVFRPCAPQYGDTTKRTFDYVAQWLAKRDRF